MIERLRLPIGDVDLRALAALLVDAVESGAAVSFLSPLPVERAEEWWRRTLAESDPRAVFLVARDADGIVGTVQLHAAWAPNQPHRAEIVKLMVHRRARGQRLGARLMRAIEEIASREGFRLLTLDAKRGEAAERLYRRLGWIAVGSIPRYALDPDGRTPHDAVVFYKELPLTGPPAGSGPSPLNPGKTLLRRADPADLQALFDVWLRSVRATHTFLSEADVDFLQPKVREYLASDATEFWIVCAASGEVAGFMGMSGNEIEAMFLAPEHSRRGLGRLLIDHARSLRPGADLTVDVNEQNAGARRFYEKCGFVVEGRSEHDGTGRPFPLLHLRLRWTP